MAQPGDKLGIGDDEAQIHYALALNTSASPADKPYANQFKGAALLSRLQNANRNIIRLIRRQDELPWPTGMPLKLRVNNPALQDP